MKKSKIIIPALAMIAFSTAASVSGAVAWFTASRQASINAGTYAVVKTNANLAVQVTSGIGTTASSVNDVHTVALEKAYNDPSADTLYKSKLTDGSFNHLNSTFYTPNATGKAYVQDLCGFNLSDANLVTKLTRETIMGGQNEDNVKIYTAVTWRVSFTISFGGVPGNVGLFLDTESSSYAVYGNADAKTAKGFRTAFIPCGTNAASGLKKVYAPLQTSDNCTHVQQYKAPDEQTHVTDMTGIAYTGDYLLSQTTIAGLSSLASVDTISASDAAARKDFMGTFVFSSGAPVTLEYDVVCWFEGTDPEIINRATAEEYQSVISTLSFKAIDLS